MKFRIKVDYEVVAKNYEEAQQKVFDELLDGGDFYENHIIIEEVLEWNSKNREEVKKTIEGTGKYLECDWDTFFNDVEYSCFCMNIGCDEFIYFREVRK